MKKLLAVALATMMTQQAMATNWVMVSEGSNGDFKDYIDLNNIQTDYLANGTPVMTAWIRTELKQARDAGNGKKLWSIKSFINFDCHTRKWSVEYDVAYDKQGRVVGSGNYAHLNRYSSADWQRVIPDTASEIWLNTVCAYAN